MSISGIVVQIAYSVRLNKTKDNRKKHIKKIHVSKHFPRAVPYLLDTCHALICCIGSI